MTEQEFNARSHSAIEEMKKMNTRSTNKQPPLNSPPKPTKKSGSLLGDLGLPFLENLKTDGDLTLILGILLLLLSEKTDKRLLFALLYILL